jgi:hypothetical protein
MEGDDREANLEFWVGRGRADAGASSGRRARSFGRTSGRWRSLRPPRLRLPGLRGASFTRPSLGRASFNRPSFTGRTEGREPDPRRGRARPVAAAALLAGLAGAWLIVGHRSHASADVEPTPATHVPASVVVGTAPRHPLSASGASAPTAPAISPSTSTSVAPRTPDCRGLSVARRAVRCVIDGVQLEIRLSAPGSAAEAYTRAAGAVARPASGSPACARGVPDERSWSEVSSPTVAIGRYRCRLEQGRAAMWWTRGDRLAHALGPNGDLAALFAWWRAHPSE